MLSLTGRRDLRQTLRPHPGRQGRAKGHLLHRSVTSKPQGHRAAAIAFAFAFGAATDGPRTNGTIGVQHVLSQKFLTEGGSSTIPCYEYTVDEAIYSCVLVGVSFCRVTFRAVARWVVVCSLVFTKKFAPFQLATPLGFEANRTPKGNVCTRYNIVGWNAICDFDTILFVVVRLIPWPWDWLSD